VSHQHLTRDQRVELGVLLRLGQKNARIASQLGVHRCTIGREIERNGHTNGSGYHARVAEAKARARRRTANRRRYRIVPGSFLASYCERALSYGLVPEQIAGRLRFVLGHGPVSCETIYRWIYLDRPDLKHLLRSSKHGYRRKRGTNARWAKREHDRKRHIWQRPEDIELRLHLGDWEGDTVHGANHEGYLATLVERVSGYTLARKLEFNTAHAFREAVEVMFQDIPVQLRRTLTLDNGSEMNEFEALEENTGTTVYFARPYHSWERGTNENTNGLLRQYFPKKQSMARVTQDDVDLAIQRLNTRPRKRLGYQSPYTVFNTRVAFRD
jgi:IS30 family transposase